MSEYESVARARGVGRAAGGSSPPGDAGRPSIADPGTRIIGALMQVEVAPEPFGDGVIDGSATTEVLAGLTGLGPTELGDALHRLMIDGSIRELGGYYGRAAA